MSARTAGRRGHEEPADFDDPDGDPAGDGVMVRLATRVIENPAMSGGLLVMALTATAVVSNALFLQHAQHPEPWFATRPATAVTPAGEAVTVPDPRPRAAAPPVPDSPPPRPQPEAPSAAAASTELVADLQRALNARGFYKGRVDGIYGAHTRAAISAFETSVGLPVTGAPTRTVLDRLAASPAPATAPPAEIPATTVTTVPVEPPASPSARAEAEGLLSYPPRPAIAAATADDTPAVVTKASAPAASADIGARRTLSVQKALNRIGYGPVPEDGVADEGTIAAIRRFELDNGLPITGAAGDTLIERLVAIGAMEAA